MAKEVMQTNTTDLNPNDIKDFVRFDEKKVKVYTTSKVIAHYPKIGTEISLPQSKADKWIEKGYATDEPVEDTEPSEKAKKA